MAFYRSNAHMQSKLAELIDKFAKDGRPGLHNSIAITWIKYSKNNPEPSSGEGASWCEEKLIYPASVVKLIFAIAAEAWIQKEIIPESNELRHAIQDMIIDSSNDATSLVIDLLTGTTSGPSMQPNKWEQWKEQRQLINKWLESLGWPENNEINCCQKTWNEAPYGREKNFYGPGRVNQNVLNTKFTARILEAVMTNNIVSPPACKRIKSLLSRSLDLNQRRGDPNNQIDGFLGEGLTNGSRIWSKAGWMSQVRHDAAWFSNSKSTPMLLVVFCQGRQLANDTFLLPAIASELTKDTD